MKRGLVLAKYGMLAASTRQRFVQAVPYLEEAGITLDFDYLLDDAYLQRLFHQGGRNTAALLGRYGARLAAVMRAGKYDFLWVQYELFPYWPGVFERLVGLSGIPVICDYDDAIFHPYDQHRNPLVRMLLSGKLQPLLRRCDLAFCGNAYLQEYVARYCARTEIIPTVVDMAHYTPDVRSAAPVPVLGWIGSPSTWRLHAMPMAGVFAESVRLGRANMLVVGAGEAADGTQPFTYRDWVQTREVADIREMDIGVMPIPDEPWARGKCGYKLIQYMACGLPVVASPVGVNREIVQHGVNGFLASTEAEWRTAIEALLADAALRQRMGQAGRKMAEEKYSIQRYGPRIVELIQELLR